MDNAHRHEPRHRPARLAVALLGTAALTMAAAACGGDDEAGTDTPSPATSPTSAPATAAGAPTASEQGEDVSLAETAAGTVLVDADGMTLYVSEQEADGEIRCDGECASIWPPATAAAAEPAVAPELAGRVATVDRPDGTRQLTFDGVPLYAFSFDESPGDTSGHNLEDDFGDTHFVWHAATLNAAAATPATTDSGATATSGSPGYPGY
jgi:predicted lipoprotein with Yx(FWY)xxD motif